MNILKKFNYISRKRIIALSMFIVYFFFSWGPRNSDVLANGMGGLIGVCLRISSLLFLIVCPKKRYQDQISTLFIWCSFLAYYFISTLWAYEDRRPSLIGILICMFLAMQEDEIKADLFGLIKQYLVLISVMGILCYISYVLPFDLLPYSIVKIRDGFGGYYCNYHFAYLSTSGYSAVRLCGLFDEPGMMGTFLAFTLCAEDLKIKKFQNFILLIAGTLTFSLAFFIILGLYFIIKNIQEPKRWAIILLFALFYVYVLPNISTGNGAIDTVISRMVITSNGFVGDNRTSAVFDRIFEETIDSARIFFGYGNGYAERYGTNANNGLASIKSFVVNFGIIGTLAMFFPLLIGCAKKCNSLHMAVYLIINMISLYQRPYLFQVPYFTMLICGLSYIKLSSQKNELENRDRLQLAILEED